MTARFIAILCVVVTLPGFALAQSNQRALIGGTLLDGSGGKPLKNSVVLIDGERITAVGDINSIRIPDGYEKISTEGMTVLPGLWDMHVHLLYAGHTDFPYWHRTYTSQYEKTIMPATAQQLLMAGVTSTRDLGAPPDSILAVKRRISQGEIPGATIYAAGPQLTHQPPDWATKYRWGISGIADAKAKVNQLADMGVDQIKVTDAETMMPDELKAIADAAHARGLKVAAHGRTLAEIRLGLAAGFDEFEHIGLQEAEYPGDLIAVIRQRNSSQKVYWAPTVGLPLSAEYLAGNPESLDDPANYAGFPPAIIEDVKRVLAKWEPGLPPTTRQIIQRKVAQLQQAGVELVIGTDGGLAAHPVSQALLRELEGWVEDLGFTPSEVIRRSTSFAANLMGAGKDYGMVAEGKFADIIVVKGDPLRHVDTLRNPAIILKHGKRYR